MSRLVVALLVFVALHSVPAIPALRSGIIATIGRRTYLAFYSLVSIAVIVWLFYEALNTEYIELWEPAPWQARVTFALAPLGLFFVITGLISANPFSVTLRRSEDSAGAIVSITRHPVLWGFLFWAVGHLFPNGDLRSVTLFGGFALFSLGGIAMTERRARKRFGPPWESAVRGTSIIPFAAIITGRGRFRMDAPLIIGFFITQGVVFWLLAGAHASYFGADPLILATSP